MNIFNAKVLFSTAIVILSCAGSATADAQQLKGVVVDERGTHIRGAQVSISELKNETVLWQGTTDSLGVFTSSAIETLLGELPIEQAEVIRLVCVDELSFVQAAELLNLSVNTAKSRYRYGIATLRQSQNLTCYES